MQSAAKWLLLTLIFMVPWEDAVTIGAWGSLARLIGIAVAGLWAMTALAKGRLRRFHPFHASLLLFVLWNMLSVFWSPDLVVTQRRIVTYIQLCLLALILWDLFTTQDALRAGLQAYVLGAWVCVFSSIANYLAGVETGPYSGGRYAATGVNAVELAVNLALALPLAWHLAVAVQSDSILHRIGRLVNFAYLPAASFAIVLTGSRTSLFAVMPTAFYILWSSRRLKLISRILILVVLVAIALALQSYLPQSALDRLGTVGTSIASADLGGRVNLWRKAMALFFSHPLVGIGSGGFSSTIIVGTWVHNTFLSVITETGMVGFELFAVMLAIVTYQVFRQPKESSILWGCVLLVWTMGALSLSWEFRKPTWLFLSLIVISASLPSASCKAGVDSASVSQAGVLPDVSTAAWARTEHETGRERC